MKLPGKPRGSMLSLVPGLVFAAAMTLSLLAWYRAWRVEDSYARDMFQREGENLRRALADSLTELQGRLLAARQLVSAAGLNPAAEPWRRAGNGFERVVYRTVGGLVPSWLAAAEQARDRGGITFATGETGQIVLILANYGGPDPGTVEKRVAALRGWFGLEIDLHGLVETALATLPLPLAVTVSDGSVALVTIAARPLRSEMAALAPGVVPAFTEERMLAVNGRTWLVRYSSAGAFDQATRTGGQIVVLVLGVGLSLALWITMTVLQSNQRRFQDIAESASDWFWETNANFEFTYISERFFEITGLSADEVLGRTQWDIAGPRQIASARQIWQAHFRVMTARESFRGLEVMLTDRNGAARHILLSGKPSYYDNGIFRGYRGIGSDITERKAAEAEAARKSAQLRAAIEAMPNGLIMFGEDLRLLLYNRRFLELWGITEEELEARRYLPHMIRFLAEQGRYGPGEVDKLVAERLARIVQPTIQGYELRAGDGRILEIRSYGRSEVGYLLTYLDITDRRRGEDALRQSEERLKLALAATRAGVWDIDLITGERWWSPEVPQMLDYAPGDLAEGTDLFNALVHADDRPAVHAHAKHHLAGLTAEFRAEYRLRRKDGSWAWIEDSGRAIRDEDNRTVRFIGTVVDISQKRATRDELIRAEKMAALGRLVAGVAHEINTPVGLGVSVASYLDQRSRKIHELYDSGEVTREDFEEYLEAVAESCTSLLTNLRRAAALVKSFKLVAVDQSSERCRPFTLGPYIDEVLTSLRPKLKKTRHVIEVRCRPDLELVSDPGAFSQILTNLVDNALVHAFDGRDEGSIIIDVAEEGDHIIMTYSDNGRGMPADQLEKIFEPFFTTRMGQGGSGLGMHVVYNLVTSTLGGRIRCDSAPDRGMIITIRVPRATPTEAVTEGNQEVRHVDSF
ncbi:MAG: PAS domain S-box protein [Rhodospirillaceae bacterium]